jgi:hypothetical protein
VRSRTHAGVQHRQYVDWRSREDQGNHALARHWGRVVRDGAIPEHPKLSSSRIGISTGSDARDDFWS